MVYQENTENRPSSFVLRCGFSRNPGLEDIDSVDEKDDDCETERDNYLGEKVPDMKIFDEYIHEDSVQRDIGSLHDCIDRYLSVESIV